MSTNKGIHSLLWSKYGHVGFPAVLLSLALVVAIASFHDIGPSPADLGNSRVKEETHLIEKTPTSTCEPVVIQLDAKKIEALRLQVESARRGHWARNVPVTGRIEFNETKVAHVSALAAGVVREICVEIGQEVQAGEVLAYIDSREVGEAKLRFAQDQLVLKYAQQAYESYSAIHSNTHDLLAALQEGKGIDEIEREFRNRAIGDYRQQLVSALARLENTAADYGRVQELGEDCVIPGKEIIRARAEYNSANAAYQAFLEQIRFDSDRQLLASEQRLKEAETALAVSRSQLFILGLSAPDIPDMDPIAEAERVAYYPVRAPFDGAVIATDAMLSKYVDAESNLMKIADMSTVWLSAGIFEKDLKAVHDLEGKKIEFRTTSYPDQVFSARFLSLGNVVDDQTRAARLLAVVDNPGRRLKPGMFAEIELNGGYDDSNIVLVPTSAIQRHDGATFVFVRLGRQQFERRDVRIGRSTSESVEITDGLDADELVVANGGFALKSEMLSKLMIDE